MSAVNFNRSDEIVSLPKENSEIGLFKCLPDEIITRIASSQNLDLPDLSHLAKTSRFFYHLLNDEVLWNKLALQANLQFSDEITVDNIKKEIFEIHRSQLLEMNHITSGAISLDTLPTIKLIQEHFLAIEKVKCKDFLTVWQKIINDIGDPSLAMPIEVDDTRNSNDLDEMFAKWIEDNAAVLSSFAVVKLGGLNLNYLPTSIGKLRRLTFLELSNNNLLYLPESIGNLSRLVGLFSDNNALQSVPESFTRLANLEILDLGGNPLKYIPDDLLRRFTDLKDLLPDESTQVSSRASSSRVRAITTHAPPIRVIAAAVTILAVSIILYNL